MDDKLKKGMDWFFNQKFHVKLVIIVAVLSIFILLSFKILGLIFPDDTPLTGVDIEKYKASCSVINLNTLKSDLNKYNGRHVNFTGEIVQILEKDGKTTIVMSVTQINNEWSNTDLIYVTYKSSTKFRRGDIITIYGGVSGTFNYMSVTLGRLVLPKIIARNIELTPITILIPVPFIKPVTNTSINNTNNPP